MTEPMTGSVNAHPEHKIPKHTVVQRRATTFGHAYLYLVRVGRVTKWMDPQEYHEFTHPNTYKRIKPWSPPR